SSPRPLAGAGLSEAPARAVNASATPLSNSAIAPLRNIVIPSFASATGQGADQGREPSDRSAPKAPVSGRGVVRVFVRSPFTNHITTRGRVVTAPATFSSRFPAPQRAWHERGRG